jgi:hypothetical protein
LRENPHRLNLCRIGLRLILSNQTDARAEDLSTIDQKLDMWSGTLTSRFSLEGKRVSVTTVVHPELDLLAVSIESPLLAEERIGVKLKFPYGSPNIEGADWQSTKKHKSTLLRQTSMGAVLKRQVDDDQYFVAIAWQQPAGFQQSSEQEFRLESKHGSQLQFTVSFARADISQPLPFFAQAFEASASYWRRFWIEGGAVELSGSRDSRAHELERRVILSRYLTAIQCSGSMPPQETGLTVNSWYGKFHLEMHWWHAAHFVLWSQVPLLEKSLGWYSTILQSARERAHQQGYMGARWPKMVGPEGRDSPSAIGPLLIWQQPHAMVMAEMCYLAHPGRPTLDRYRDIVLESAEFMASFAFFEQTRSRYVLGPPVIPAQENHPPRETWNPTFELAYWGHGLRIAQRWRERLGLKPDARFDKVINGLSKLPVGDGVYLAHENCPQTYSQRNSDHPSMLSALGVLPGDGADRFTMRRTLEKVFREWQWDKTWGWDYPMTAMTAARLGQPKLAVDALLMETEKNRYLPNGHNWQRENLPCYLPGNGGLLYAVAMMARGWRGSSNSRSPGFPDDGSWSVRAEGLNDAVLREI